MRCKGVGGALKKELVFMKVSENEFS